MPGKVLRALWCNRLPGNVQTILAAQEDSVPLDKVSKLADQVHELASKPIVIATANQTDAQKTRLTSYSKKSRE